MTIAAYLRMSSGSKLHSISHALVGVVLMALLMNRKAWFCSLSNVARCVCVAIQCCKVCVCRYPMLQGVCVAVPTAALLYSRESLTQPIQSCHSVCVFGPHLVLASFLTIFNRCLAFAAVFSMCFQIDSLWSSRRSMYSGASSFCISSPPCMIFTLVSTLYLLEKIACTVLFVSRFSFHRLPYVHRLRRLVLTSACALYIICDLVDQSIRSSP